MVGFLDAVVLLDGLVFAVVLFLLLVLLLLLFPVVLLELLLLPSVSRGCIILIYSSRGRRFIYCSIRAHSSCIGIKVGGRNLQIQSRANSFNTIYTTATCSTPSIIIYFKCSLTTSHLANGATNLHFLHILFLQIYNIPLQRHILHIYFVLLHHLYYDPL